MKQQVDFYLLDAGTFAGCFPFVCRLVEKTYQQGFSSLIRVNSEEEAEKLDELLWTFRPASFVPHQRQEKEIRVSKAFGEAMPTVVIECRLVETPQRVEGRVLQMAPNEPKLLDLARKHYRFYQQEGYLLNNHRVKI